MQAKTVICLLFLLLYLSVDVSCVCSASNKSPVFPREQFVFASKFYQNYKRVKGGYSIFLKQNNDSNIWRLPLLNSRELII